MDKGCLAADILEQCRKMDEAGMEYYFVYMTGPAGKAGGYWNALNSAELFSQLNPYFISVDSLTLFPDTELYRMEQEGQFAPAGEKERLAELQVLIKNLQIRTHLKLLGKRGRLEVLCLHVGPCVGSRGSDE